MSLSAWIEGARPKTLPAAAAPVIAGSAVALFNGSLHLGKALLCALIALALQVGVNFANDYSDGVRGTDDHRVGPQRLVGSGAARPETVRLAGFGCFGLAAVAGLILVIWTQAWWLLLVGAAAIAAAWFYTGGRRPYGYAGWGEVFVFVFFGLVATAGTTFVQLGVITEGTAWAGVAMGALACALLVSNNLRDLGTDAVAGKKTLAVRLGDRRTRWFFVALVALTVIALIQVAAATTWWGLLGLLSLVFLAGPVRFVLGGAEGRTLLRVLRLTGIASLVAALGLFIGLWIG